MNSDLDYIYKLINPILEEKRPYWGYEEKVNFINHTYLYSGYLLENDDEIIIEIAKLFLNGTNNS